MTTCRNHTKIAHISSKKSVDRLPYKNKTYSVQSVKSNASNLLTLTILRQQSWSKIKILDLSDSNIDSLSVFMSTLVRQKHRPSLSIKNQNWLPQELQILNLSHNRISKIQNCILSLSKLQNLNLSHNRIIHLPELTNMYFSQIKYVDLSSNIITAVRSNIQFVVDIVQNRSIYLEIFNNPLMQSVNVATMINNMFQQARKRDSSKYLPERYIKKQVKQAKLNLDGIKTKRYQPRVAMKSNVQNIEQQNNYHQRTLTGQAVAKPLKNRQKTWFSQFCRLISRNQNKQNKQQPINKDISDINLSSLSQIVQQDHSNCLTNAQYIGSINQNIIKAQNEKQLEIDCSIQQSEANALKDILKKYYLDIFSALDRKKRSLNQLKQYFYLMEAGLLQTDKSNRFSFSLDDMKQKVESLKQKQAALKLVQQFRGKFIYNNQQCISIINSQLEGIKNFNNLKHSRFEHQPQKYTIELKNICVKSHDQTIETIESNQKIILAILLSQPIIQHQTYLIPIQPYKIWTKSFKKVVLITREQHFSIWNNLLIKYFQINKIINNKKDICFINFNESNEKSSKKTIAIKQASTPNKHLNRLLFSQNKQSNLCKESQFAQKTLIQSTPQQKKEQNNSSVMTPCHKCFLLTNRIQKLQNKICVTTQQLSQANKQQQIQKLQIKSLKQKILRFQQIKETQKKILRDIQALGVDNRHLKPRAQTYQCILLLQAKAIQQFIQLQQPNLSLFSLQSDRQDIKQSKQDNQQYNAKRKLNTKSYQNKQNQQFNNVGPSKNQSYSNQNYGLNNSNNVSMSIKTQIKNKQRNVNLPIPQKQRYNIQYKSKSKSKKAQQYDNKTEKQMSRLKLCYFQSNQHKQTAICQKQQQNCEQVDQFCTQQNQNQNIIKIQKLNACPKTVFDEIMPLKHQQSPSLLLQKNNETRIYSSLGKDHINYQVTSVQQRKPYTFYKNYHLRNRIVNIIAQNVYFKQKYAKDKGKNIYFSQKKLTKTNLSNIKTKICHQILNNSKENYICKNGYQLAGLEDQYKLCKSRYSKQILKQHKDQLLLSASPNASHN